MGVHIHKKNHNDKRMVLVFKFSENSGREI